MTPDSHTFVPFTSEELSLLWAAWDARAPDEAKVARDVGITRGEAWALADHPNLFHLGAGITVAGIPITKAPPSWRSPDAGSIHQLITEWPPLLPSHLPNCCMVTSAVYLPRTGPYPDHIDSALTPEWQRYGLTWTMFCERAFWYPPRIRIHMAFDIGEIPDRLRSMGATRSLEHGYLTVGLEWCDYSVIRPLTEESIRRHTPTNQFHPPVGYTSWEAVIEGKETPGFRGREIRTAFTPRMALPTLPFTFPFPRKAP